MKSVKLKNIRALILGLLLVGGLPMARAEVQMAGDIVVSAPGQVSSGGLQSRSGRSITPVAVKSTRNTTMGSYSGGSSATPIFTSTSRLKGGSGKSGGGFSGGAAAGGLMSSGSRYSSAAANGGGGGATVSASTTPSGPRRTNGYPDIPFPDEEQPLGDVMWPMMALACAYVLARAFLKYLLYRKKQ